MHVRTLATVVLATALAGCYHATIETGAKPSAVTVEKKWASAWIYGLVPPSTIETAAKCPSGVAKVETQLGFLNMVVGVLTLGIYTPMDIRVACAEGAAGGTAFVVPDSASAASWQATILLAAQASRDLNEAVYVQVGH
jgi:Bor protein